MRREKLVVLKWWQGKQFWREDKSITTRTVLIWYLFYRPRNDDRWIHLGKIWTQKKEKTGEMSLSSFSGMVLILPFRCLEEIFNMYILHAFFFSLWFKFQTPKPALT